MPVMLIPIRDPFEPRRRRAPGAGRHSSLLLPEHLINAKRRHRVIRAEAVDYSLYVDAIYSDLQIIVFFHPALSLPIQFLFRRRVDSEVESLRRATGAENQVVHSVDQVVLGGVGVAVEDNVRPPFATV